MDIFPSKLTRQEKIFFRNVSSYIKQPIYFFGSIRRYDYFPGHSDIDVAIFSPHLTTTIHYLCSYLEFPPENIHNTVYKLDNKLIPGKKFKYMLNGVPIEFSLYDDKHKQIVLKTHEINTKTSLLATILIVLIKYGMYTLKIVPTKVYVKVKRFLFNNNKVEFVTL